MSEQRVFKDYRHILQFRHTLEGFRGLKKISSVNLFQITLLVSSSMFISIWYSHISMLCNSYIRLFTMTASSWSKQEKIISTEKQNQILELIRVNFHSNPNETINVGLLYIAAARNEDEEASRFLIFLTGYNPILLSKQSKRIKQPYVFASTSMVSVSVDFFDWLDKKWIQNILKYEKMDIYLARCSVFVTKLNNESSPKAFEHLEFSPAVVESESVLALSSANREIKVWLTTSGPIFSNPSDSSCSEVDKLLAEIHEESVDPAFQKFIRSNAGIIQNFSFPSISIQISRSMHDTIPTKQNISMAIGGFSDFHTITNSVRNGIISIPTSIRCPSFAEVLRRLSNLYDIFKSKQ